MSYRVSAGSRHPALSVRVLGRSRHKPSGEPDVRSETLPQASVVEATRLSWADVVQLAPVVLFAAVMLPVTMAGSAYFALYALWGNPAAFVVVGIVAVLIAVLLAKRDSSTFLEFEADGIVIRNSKDSRSNFISYASIRDVQTYLDQEIGSGTWRGLILDVAGAGSVTLELGDDTRVVVESICKHTSLVARHARCSWQGVGF